MAALSWEYVFETGATKPFPSEAARSATTLRRKSLELTPPESATFGIRYRSAARKSFFERISATVRSNSNEISRRSKSERAPDSAILRSISRLTAALSPENEKSRESFARMFVGKILRNSPECSAASFETTGHPGKPNPIDFATLSNASPAASSIVSQRSSRSKGDFQR